MHLTELIERQIFKKKTFQPTVTDNFMEKSAIMHFTDFKSTKYLEKTLFYPIATDACQGLSQHCHKRNQLLGMNNDL